MRHISEECKEILSCIGLSDFVKPPPTSSRRSLEEYVKHWFRVPAKVTQGRPIPMSLVHG